MKTKLLYEEEKYIISFYDHIKSSGFSKFMMQTYLLLDVRPPKRQDKGCAVFSSQSVYASGVDGSHEILVDLVFGVFVAFDALAKAESVRSE